MTNRTFSILLVLLSCCSISFIGTTIWLLLERNENESCSVDGFLHQGKHGQIKLSRNGNLELMNDKKWTVYGSLGSHVKNASPESCSERDFCLGKFSRSLIKSQGRPDKVINSIFQIMVPQKLQSRSKKSLILRAIILTGLLQIIQLHQLTASKMEKIFFGMVEQRSITNNGRLVLLDSGKLINKVTYN